MTFTVLVIIAPGYLDLSSVNREVNRLMTKNFVCEVTYLRHPDNWSDIEHKLNYLPEMILYFSNDEVDLTLTKLRTYSFPIKHFRR